MRLSKKILTSIYQKAENLKENNNKINSTIIKIRKQ